MRVDHGAHDGWEKRNVVIVNVSLPIAIDLVLRRKSWRHRGVSMSCGCVKCPLCVGWLLEPKRSWLLGRRPGSCSPPGLAGSSGSPASCDSELDADLVPSCAEERNQDGNHPVVRLRCTWLQSACACLVVESFNGELFAAALSELGVLLVWEEGEHENL